MSNTYVTSTGLVLPTLATIKTNLETAFKAAWGTDIDVSSTGPFGQFIDLMALSVSDAFLLGQEIYTSRNVNEATGTSLDHISAETGTRRVAATGTRVANTVLYGTEGTIVIAGKQIRQASTTLNYSLESAVTITKSAARDAELEPNDLTAGLTYTVTIDTIPVSYVVLSGDEASDVIDGLISAITSADPNDFITNGGTVTNVDDTYLRLTFETTDFALLWNSYLSLNKLGSAGTFVADETGANSLSANSLTVIGTPVSGWDSVNNPLEGTTGRALETDSEFRIRRASSIGEGAATEGAIKQALLNEVEGVTAVAITSNRTSSVDSEGRPAKSFEVVIEGGADADVALTIWNEMPAGIEAYGSTSETIVDSEGYDQIISFSRSTNKYLHVKVRRAFYNEESYPADGDLAIKEAIVAWALTEFDLGVDVIYQRISTPVYTVAGVGEIEITVDVTASPGDTPALAASNITIANDELVLVDVSRITVELLP